MVGVRSLQVDSISMSGKKTLEVKSESVHWIDVILDIRQQQQLVWDKIHECVKLFAPEPGTPNIECHSILDMGMDGFAFTPFTIDLIEIGIIDTQVSEIHTDLFRPVMFIEKP